MSRIYEALRRAEGSLFDTEPGTEATGPPGPSSPASGGILDEYPYEESPAPRPVMGPPASIVVPAAERAPVAEPLPAIAARAPRTPEPRTRTEAPPAPARESSAWTSTATRIVSTAQRVDERTRPDATWDARLVAGAGPTLVSVREYRRIAAALHDAQGERGLRTLLVSSALPDEGRTLTVANLGLTLSESYGSRVLLIDADLRAPALHRVFGAPNHAGLIEALRQNGGDLPLVDISPSLSLLCAGQPGASPLAGLTSTRMATLIEDCGAQFDWVLVDVPPVGLVPGAARLATLAQAVVFVIRAGTTRLEQARQAAAELGTERIVGTILNRC